MYFVVACNWNMFIAFQFLQSIRNMLIVVPQNNVEFLYAILRQLTNEGDEKLICLSNPSGIFLGNSMAIDSTFEPLSSHVDNAE